MEIFECTPPKDHESNQNNSFVSEQVIFGESIFLLYKWKVFNIFFEAFILIFTSSLEIPIQELFFSKPQILVDYKFYLQTK